MTFTYSGDPSSSTRDLVRFKIGDTDSASPILADAEVDYLLLNEGSTAQAILAAALEVLTRFARQVDKTVGPTQIAASQRHAQYKETVERLKREFRRGSVPFAGGISIDDKERRIDDDDRVRPAFTRNMQEFDALPARNSAALKQELD